MENLQNDTFESEEFDNYGYTKVPTRWWHLADTIRWIAILLYIIYLFITLYYMINDPLLYLSESRVQDALLPCASIFTALLAISLIFTFIGNFRENKVSVFRIIIDVILIIAVWIFTYSLSPNDIVEIRMWILNH